MGIFSAAFWLFSSCRGSRPFWPAAVLYFPILLVAPSAGLGEEVALSAWYGFDQRGRLGCWTPVTVEVSFTPAAPTTLEADVRIVRPPAAEGGEAFAISRGLRMGPGTKCLTLCLVPQYGDPGWRQLRKQGTAVEVFDRRRGQLLAATALPAADDLGLQIEADFFIVILGKDRVGLRAILQQRRARAKRSQRPGALATVAAATLAPSLAPDCVAGYDGVDAILWEDPRPADLRSGQREALAHWVRAGGRLVLCFSAQAEADLAQLAELLPGRISGKREASLRDRPDGGRELPEDLAQACSGRWEADEHLRQKAAANLAAGQRAFPLFSLHPTKGRVILPTSPLVASGGALAVRGAYGWGSVVMLAPDLTAWPLANHPGRDAFLGRALGIAFYPEEIALWRSGAGREIGQGRMWPQRFAPLALTAAEVARAYLTAAPSLRPAPFAWLAASLMVYVLLAGPLTYWLLRRCRRLSWTTLALLAQVAIFSAGAYLGGRWWKGSRAFCRSLTLRDEIAGGISPRQTIYTGLFSSDEQRCDLSFGRAAYPLAVAELLYTGFETQADGYAHIGGGASELRQEEQTFLRALPLRQWAMKEFVIPIWREEPAIVSGMLSSQGGELRGEIRLPPGYRLDDTVIVWRRGAMRVGSLIGVWRPVKVEYEPIAVFLASLASGGAESSEEGANATPALIENLMRASLGALLWGWEERAMLAQAQFSALPPDTGQPAPAIGLSLEQWWNAQPRQRRDDLSDIIREGGVILFGRLSGAVLLPDFGGQNFESEGIVIIRAVFLPPSPAEGGAIWRDDLYSPSFKQ